MNSYLMVNFRDLCKNGVLVDFLVIKIEWSRFGPLVTYELSNVSRSIFISFVLFIEPIRTFFLIGLPLARAVFEINSGDDLGLTQKHTPYKKFKFYEDSKYVKMIYLRGHLAMTNRNF